MVDYSSDASRADKAAEVVGIMETLGFLFLENVPGFDEDELRWCVDFFFEGMPAEKKLQVARILYNPDSKQVGHIPKRVSLQDFPCGRGRGERVSLGY